MNTKRSQLQVETLEDRRVMAVIAGAHWDPPALGDEVQYVAPPQPGFVPLAVPTGIDIPGTTELTSPATQPQLSGLAETYTSELVVGWLRIHPDAVGDVTTQSTRTSFSFTISATEGTDFFKYTVTETARAITVSYVSRDDAHSEILSSFENPTALNGGLVYAQFDNNLLTAAVVHSEIAGNLTSWQYPEVSTLKAQSLTASVDVSSKVKPTKPVVEPGLGDKAERKVLDALVESHLTGPAKKDAYKAWTNAADSYFAELGHTSCPRPHFRPAVRTAFRR